MSSRIVTVFGATGKQGSSVVRALLKDGTFKVRAVTRKVQSQGAQALKAAGADVVEANLLVRSSVEDAVAGSEAVFGVTNYYDADNFDGQKIKELSGNSEATELIQGKNLIAAAKKAGVKFFVWSSLPNTSEISKALHAKNSKIKHFDAITHFDVKAAVDKELETSGLNYAILHTGWFLENLWSYGPPKTDANGVATIRAPAFRTEDQVAGQDGPPQYYTYISRDLGSAALAVLKNYQSRGAEISSKTFHVVSFKAPYEELARSFTKSVGKEFKFSGEGTNNSEEFDQMYEYQATIGFYPGEPIPDPRLVSLGAKFTSLEEFTNDAEVKAKLA